MITIRFSGRVPSPRQSQIGMETDQRAETLRFLLPQISDSQSAQLMLLLPDGTADELQIRSGQATLPARVTEIPGRTRAWVEILGEDTVAWNSELFYLEVGDLPPISERTEQQYPTAIQEALAACVKTEEYMHLSRQVAALVLACGMFSSITVQNGVLMIDQARLEDADAYALAVRNGYEGTAEDWEEAVAAVAGNAALIASAVSMAQAAQTATEAAQTAASAAQTAATAAQTAAQGALAAVTAMGLASASVTIAASAWTGNEAPYTATVQCAAATAGNTLTVGVGGSMTAAQYLEIARARLVCTGQGAGTITLTAFGKKPANSITVNVWGVNI